MAKSKSKPKAKGKANPKRKKPVGKKKVTYSQKYYSPYRGTNVSGGDFGEGF